MTALTKDFPRKSSRTSTQAVIVPKTAFTSVASVATTRLSLSAATASGFDTASQNPDAPSFDDAQTRAAIGSATTRERNRVTKPRERAVDALSPDCRRLLGTATASTALARGRPPDLLLDPDHEAVARVDPLLIDGAPAAERLVGDREDARARRELVGVLLRDGLVDRPEPVLREQGLRPVGLRVADELVRQVLVRAPLQHRDRELDQHRLARDHVLDVGAGQPCVQGLALVREEDVA